MNARSFFSLLLIIPILAGSVAFTQNTPPAVSPQVTGLATNTDVAIGGTGWVPQKAANFKSWVVYGWGVYTQASGAGNRWVHMPLVYPTYIGGTPQKTVLVQFCAQSSNGAATYPFQMDLWRNNVKILSEAVVWPADNNYHCWTHNWAVPTWYEAMSISVWLKYANTTDGITLYKAWMKVQP